jgi:hypothetical protein
VKFASDGENTAQKPLTFQWQKGVLTQTLPISTAGSSPPLMPKPAFK